MKKFFNCPILFLWCLVYRIGLHEELGTFCDLREINIRKRTWKLKKKKDEKRIALQVKCKNNIQHYPFQCHCLSFVHCTMYHCTIPKEHQISPFGAHPKHFWIVWTHHNFYSNRRFVSAETFFSLFATQSQCCAMCRRMR